MDKYYEENPIVLDYNTERENWICRSTDATS